MKRKEYNIDGLAAKAAKSLLVCKHEPDTTMKIIDAMRAKGYSKVEARTLLAPENRTNVRKLKAIHNQAHVCITTIVAEERVKKKENHHMIMEVILQVEGEFKAHGFEVILSKLTINQFMRDK